MIGVTGRSILTCPTGDCIILHYPPAAVKPNDLSQFLAGDPDTPDDDGELYSDPSGRWCQAGESYTALNSFNCCTFAVGDVVGLTPDDWISPTRNGDTYFTLPMQVILDSYFERIQVYKYPIADWAVLESDPQLRAGDVICLMNVRSDWLAYAHAGRICKKNGKNWVISKFGAGPIVKTTLEAIGREYAHISNEIRIYRAKGEPVHERGKRHGV